MPHSKWITAAQYKLLSKYDKIWAENLLVGRLTVGHNDKDERDIGDWDYCIVGVLHNCLSAYSNCQRCTDFAIALNNEYQNRVFENYGAKQFRQVLGEFLAHYGIKHYAKRERDITKCQ